MPNTDLNVTITDSLPTGLVPPHVMALKPYRPGKPPDILKQELGIDNFINLASNENSLGPPESVMEAVRECLNTINRYPEMGGTRLRQALADHYHAKIENVAIGSGSESILANTVRAFLHNDDEVLTSEGTFIGLYVLVNAQGIKLNTVPLKNYTFDLESIAEAINPKTKIVYLCNPNNPTGTIFKRKQFETFMKSVPEHVLVILDEAYVDFTSSDMDFPNSMQYRLDNVLTLRTFSKAYGMAGLRVGYGLGHEILIDYINRIKLPFEPSIPAQAAGLAALDDHDFLDRTKKNNKEGKRFLNENLDRLGFQRAPSYSNFVMVEMGSEERAAALNMGLLRHGIAVRPLGPFGLPSCVRITIGSPEEMEKLVKALEAVSAAGL
ncbi:MAG: histidinol-phosphate transaminase [Cyanobacteria bacterium HKST-UBA02]|nr:histidinol-phosphate transaminase [Cyanobacteria bacterium HKST-UBA02]